MIERPELRTLFSKTFEIAPNKFQCVIQSRPPHIPDNFAAYRNGLPTTFSDRDDALRDDSTDITNGTGWYGFTVKRGAVGFRYVSKLNAGYEVNLTLKEIGGSDVFTVPEPRIDGNKVWFDQVVPGLSFYIQAGAANVELFKVIHDATAPRSFLWEVAETPSSAVRVQQATQGVDNYDMSNPAREGTGPGRRCRRLVMAEPVVSSRRIRAGLSVYTILEEWTGNTVALDENRVPSVSNEVSYPLLIDVLVTEDIAADGDDGQGRNDSPDFTWANYYSTGRHIMWDATTASRRPGYRFQTVPIAQGVTIDDATLKLELVNAAAGAGPATVVKGYDTDDAGAWTTGGPTPWTVTETTASGDSVSWTTATTLDLACTAVVQEIVDRVSWASNNSMALHLSFTAGTSNVYCYFEDINGTDNGRDPQLVVNYTVGGGGLSIPIAAYHYQHNMGSNL